MQLGHVCGSNARILAHRTAVVLTHISPATAEIWQLTHRAILLNLVHSANRQLRDVWLILWDAHNTCGKSRCTSVC